MVKTPMLDKMLAVKERSQAIGEFLDWLERKVVLATYHVHNPAPLGCYTPDDEDQEEPTCGYNERALYPYYPTIEGLLAEYFEIDLAAAEREKQVLLTDLRSQ